MNASGIAIAALQVILVAVGAPFLVALMRRMRARLEGRQGPPLRQSWRDLRKLLAKDRMVPANASWVFPLAPFVLGATVVAVSGIVPFITTRSGFDHAGDLFTVVYLLLLGTVFLSLAGLDAGTAFGGMGSSRTITIAALAEPAILLAVFALSVPAGSSNLGAIVSHALQQPGSVASVQSVFAFAALTVVTLAETGRLPIDNPSTHLELTMVHEAMVLEYAGPDLAVVELAGHMRLVVFLGLLANLFMPWGISTTMNPIDLVLAVAAVAAKIAVLGIAIATFEVFVAKLRLFRVPELLAASFVLSFLAVTSSFLLL